MTNNSQRLKTYRNRMKAAGFSQMTIWVHPDLLAELQRIRTRDECYGRTLERLLLNEVRRRPGDHWWKRLKSTQK